MFLQQMELGAKLFHKYHNLSTFRGSNELQMTTMLAVVGHWRQRFTEDFAIIHDASSNFLRSREMWEKITNNNVPKQMHRLGDGSLVEFPLRVRSTTALDSMKSRSIQFCDILAGVATRHFSPFTDGDDRKFIDELIETGLKNLTFNGIRPSCVFPNQIPPKRLTGPDIVDQMSRIIYGPHNERN